MRSITKLQRPRRGEILKSEAKPSIKGHRTDKKIYEFCSGKYIGSAKSKSNFYGFSGVRNLSISWRIFEVHNDRKQKLIELGSEALADALLDLAIHSDAAHNLIERLPATPEKRVQMFKKELPALKSSTHFVSWPGRLKMPNFSNKHALPHRVNFRQQLLSILPGSVWKAAMLKRLIHGSKKFLRMRRSCHMNEINFAGLCQGVFAWRSLPEEIRQAGRCRLRLENFC